MLLGRTLSVLTTMTLGTVMAARQGTLVMAAHQICLQVWLAVSLLSDALAVSAQTGVFVGIALALLLFSSFGRLAELFSKDPMVIQIVGSGVLFVSASQPINALAFIFDGLHFGVSDFICGFLHDGSWGTILFIFAICSTSFWPSLGLGWPGSFHEFAYDCMIFEATLKIMLMSGSE